MQYQQTTPHSRAIALVRVFSAAVLIGLLAANAHGQAVSSAELQAQQPTSTTRAEQKIQRIRTEDAGSRIDEVRVGGQTQRITVQPKGIHNIPAYDVNPVDNSRGASPAGTSSATTGSRVWNVLKF